MAGITGPMYYVLDGHKPVPVASSMEWAREFDSDSRIVKQDDVGDKRVSTVFIGIPQVGPGFLDPNVPPLLFETMVFGPPTKKGGLGNSLYQDRYATWEEAERGHAKAVEWVKQGCKRSNNASL